jgi:plasmid stabilization system protein ParE
MRQADSGEFAPEAEVRAALEAIADIDRIYDFIAASNPRAAKAIVDD